MSAFEFYFSFYGLALGLSVAVVATGLATAIQHRKAIRIGWLTPLLALFVGLDIATFWDAAWHTFRDAPFSYGMLVIGLAIAILQLISGNVIAALMGGLSGYLVNKPADVKAVAAALAPLASGPASGQLSAISAQPTADSEKP